MRHALHLSVLLLVLGCAAPSARAAQEPPADAPEDGFEPLRFGDPQDVAYDVPFFPGADYDESIPTAEAVLGQEQGSRLAHHAEILTAFRAWAAASPRLSLETYGRTHEGRELVYAVVSAPENLARLEGIRADLARLADPRGTDAAEARAIAEESPAVAWMGYSIHGDELSGADASMALAYHLIASSGDDVMTILRNVVVVIDPCMNPDGRERIISMVEQSAGKTPSFDYASMQRGRWPYGRGNHYLFDMNRDWMAGTQPETRGRWRVAGSFHPQLFVDAHEMGPLETFLFYPQSRPLNPNLPPNLVEWQRRYAEGAAAAFDRHGWSYYTREWADAWAPFYSDAWGSLSGATGILYEQARNAGFPLRRASGELLTYRETVHHQVTASFANLTTLAQDRQRALTDYFESRRRNVAADTPGNDRAFVAVPGPNTDRTDELLRILLGQDIEVFRASDAFRALHVTSHLGEGYDEKELPAGSLVVPARQPLGPMARAYLDFDARMPLDDLQREREEIERKDETRIFDLTAWSLPHALDVESYWCDAPGVALEPARLPARAEARVAGPAPAVGWVVSGAGDASVSFAARAMEAGLAVYASDEPFTLRADAGEAAGQPRLVQVPAGSLLVRAVENEGSVEEVEARVAAAAREAGVEEVLRAGSGLAPGDGPDLGGGHFLLLARPRVAILSNAPVSSDSFGHLWHHLDRVVGVPFSQLDAQELGNVDLRRYNVLVLPPGRLDPVLEEIAEELAAWVEGGGTLIACGESAAALTAGRLGLSRVTLRRDALEDLTPYRLATRREWDALEIEIDEAAVWGGEPAEAEAEGEDAPDPYAAEEVPEEEDQELRRFSPYGVTLRGIVDPQSWIARGAGPELPVLFTGSYVFLSKAPVRAAVRLAEEPRLRLAGLVWPEARERIAGSAWLTVEPKGHGQILLFAAVPAFRGYYLATGRLFANAVVLGPGGGASQPIGW